MRKVIYQTALQAAQENNGTIPPYFKVEQPDRRLRYKHQWIQDPIVLNEHLFDQVFDLLEENRVSDALHAVDQIFADAMETSEYEKVIRKDVHNHQDLMHTDQMISFLKNILKYTIYPEGIQFALILSEYVTKVPEDLKKIILFYAGMEQFSPGAIQVIVHWKNGNDLIYGLAKTTYGQAKVNAVKALKPADQEIRDWLLHVSAGGSVYDRAFVELWEYGPDISEKLDFDQMLENPDLKEDDLTAIGTVILACDDACPDLVWSERKGEGNNPVQKWKDLFEKYFDRIQNIHNLKTVDDMIGYYREMGHEDQYEDQNEKVRTYLKSPESEPYVRQWMRENGTDEIDFGRRYDKPDVYHLDVSEDVLKRIHENPAHIAEVELIHDPVKQKEAVTDALSRITPEEMKDHEFLFWAYRNMSQETEYGTMILKNTDLLNQIFQTMFTEYVNHGNQIRNLFHHRNEVANMGIFQKYDRLKKEKYHMHAKTDRLYEQAVDVIGRDQLEQAIKNSEIKLQMPDLH